jgi:hypothetical protein
MGRTSVKRCSRNPLLFAYGPSGCGAGRLASLLRQDRLLLPWSALRKLQPVAVVGGGVVVPLVVEVVSGEGQPCRRRLTLLPRETSACTVRPLPWGGRCDESHDGLAAGCG